MTAIIKKSLKWIKWTALVVLLIVGTISTGIYLMKDKIINQAVIELNKNLNSPVDVKEIDLSFWSSFPMVSIDLKDVLIHDAGTTNKKDTLFYSELVRLKLNAIDAFNKKYEVKVIDVKPGYAHIKFFKNGTVNYDIVKPSEQNNPSPFILSLNKVNLSDFKFDYSNYISGQKIKSQLNYTSLAGKFSDQKMTVSVESDLKVFSVFNKGTRLLKNQNSTFDILVNVDKVAEQTTINSAPIQIANLPFVIDLKANQNVIDFKLTSDKVKIQDVVNTVEHASLKNISDYQGAGIVTLDFSYLENKSASIDPVINCKLKVENGELTEPIKKSKITQLNVIAEYTNKDERQRESLRLKKLNFSTLAGPFESELNIEEFDAPHLYGKAKGQIDLQILFDIFPMEEIQRIAGNIQVNSNFDVKKLPNDWIINDCDGNLVFNQVQLQLKEDKRFFDHITGIIALNKDQAEITDLTLTVGKSDLRINGRIASIQNYINKKGSLIAQVDIKSAFLDVQDFSSATKEKEIADGRNFLLPNDITADVSLFTNNLTYENHQFKSLKTDLSINQRVMLFQNLSLQNAQANIDGYVRIEERNPEVFTISSIAHSKNIAFKPLFKEWNNFEQEVIQSENIDGLAEIELNFTAPFDIRSGIDKNALVSTIKIKILDGKLKNVGAFKSITESLSASKATRLILKEKNIENFENQLLNLQFAELENTIIIQDGRVTIPQMTISSNAITVNIAGTHDFDNQVDYRLDFNLRDIKKTVTQTEFGEVVDDGTGLRLFVRMFGPLDNPTVKWDQMARREIAKATLEAEKKTAKEILKSEFGLYKNDDTIKAFVAKEAAPKERIKVDFDPSAEPIPEVVPKKKTGKVGKTLQKWKEEAESKSKEKFDIDAK